MILFLYGLDTYRSRQKLQEIIADYKKTYPKGLNLKYFDCQSANFQDFQDEIKQCAMFKEKKLIVLENAFASPEFKKKLLENVERCKNIKDIIIFHTSENIPAKDPLFDALRKQAKSQEFKLLTGQGLRAWARNEFKKYQCQVSENSLEKMIDFIGNDLWRFSNEIKKMVNYKAGQNIEVKDIELLVKPRIETDIFETINAIALRNKKQAFLLIRKHLEKGDNPLYLLSMINFQFRNLLIVKNLADRQNSYYSVSKASGLHPFVVKKSLPLASKFTFEELKKIYQKIFQADLQIKTGRINPEIALDLLIAEI
jgi:DNA polymerase-3 subunit delta